MARQTLHAKYANVDWFSWVSEHLAPGDTEHVLDIGCGTGTFWQATLPATPSNLSLTLTDLSPGMVAQAQASLSITHPSHNIAYIAADATALPFAAARFDAVLAMHMMYHVPNPAGALRELARVLRPAGRCCVTVNGTDNMAELRALAAHVFGTANGGWGDTTLDAKATETLMCSTFSNVVRHDLYDVMVVTEAEDLVSYLLSTPQADAAGARARQKIERAVHDTMKRSDGEFTIAKRLHLIEGRVTDAGAAL